MGTQNFHESNGFDSSKRPQNCGRSLVTISSAGAAKADDAPVVYQYENRDQNSNKDAIIREDYWWMMG